MFRHRQKGNEAQADRHALRCSFCSKTRGEVRKLIAGPSSVCICDECVQVCVDIVQEDDRFQAEAGRPRGDADPKLQPPRGAGPVSAPCALCGTPTPTPALLWIPGRGGLCPDCLAAIQAVLAVRRNPGA